MKRTSAIAILIIVLSCLLPGVLHAATGRALSLKVLESKLRGGSTADASDLCGITWVLGYVIDRQNKDVILVGVANPNYPTLHLQDLMVAFRNAQGLYGEKKGRTLYYTAPGCSIDPMPEVLRQLQEVGRKLSTASSVEESHQILAEWEQVGKQPQKVRVLGIPFDTHFAQVMVDADYKMKGLVNGSLDLGIPGFRNLMEMHGDKPEEAMNTLDRFWFCPGDSTFSEENGLTLLSSCQVKLLTEQEMINESGSRTSSGRPNPLAQRFAEDFTTHYQDIATSEPIYRELEGLFRFAGVAGLIRDQKALAEAGIKLPYIVEKYPIPKSTVSRTLPGATRVIEDSKHEQTENGETIRHRMQMSCGGVNMNVRPRRVSIPKAQTRTARGETGKVTGKAAPKSHVDKTAAPSRMAQIKKTVVTTRKSSQALTWDFHLPD